MAGEGLPRLHWADYLVIVLSLVVALGIGIFFAIFKGGQKTKDQYLVGDRRMGLAPVCLSLFITYQSAISLIGYPSDVYNTGSMVLYIYFGICLAYAVSSFTIVPLTHPLRLTSIYQYVLLRFKSQVVRLLITCVGMTQLTLYMAFVLYSPALVLQAVVGLPLWLSLAVVGSIGTIYTTIGGIKSVLWTDVFQTVMVFVGIFTVLIKGMLSVGGFSKLWNIAADGGRLIFDDTDPKARHSVWSTIGGGFVSWLTVIFSQPAAQRIGAMPTVHRARWCFIINAPLNLVYGSIVCLMGLMVYAYFVTTGCDPYAAGYIHNKNQVMPYFVLHLLRDLPGLTGVYLSMLFCGSLSTLSSGINSLAANTVEDILARPLRGMKDTTVTVIAKLIVLGYGAVSLGLAYLMRNVPGPVTQLAGSTEGALGGPVLGVLCLAASFPRANKYGAGGGMIAGLAVSLTLGIGSTLYGKPTPSLPSGPVDRCDVTNGSSVVTTSVSPVTTMSFTEGTFRFSTADPGEYSTFAFWDLSYLWLSVVGFGTTFISGIVISLITGCQTDQEDVDSRLIFPCCRKLYGLPDPEDTPPHDVSPLPLKGHQRKETNSDHVEMSAFLCEASESPSA